MRALPRRAPAGPEPLPGPRGKSAKLTVPYGPKTARICICSFKAVTELLWPRIAQVVVPRERRQVWVPPQEPCGQGLQPGALGGPVLPQLRAVPVLVASGGCTGSAALPAGSRSLSKTPDLGPQKAVLTCSSLPVPSFSVKFLGYLELCSKTSIHRCSPCFWEYFPVPCTCRACQPATCWGKDLHKLPHCS